ncbi:MAG TPA: hypothetical protein VLZ83_08545 [Edaphocola sp.]|nr:hypothetical protein [Edaphocola sp.]
MGTIGAKQSGSMKIDLDNRKFKVQSNTDNGEVSVDTIFHYSQNENIISANYQGGDIVKGSLIGKVVDNKYLDFVYQHINVNGEIMTGVCQSYPDILDSGKMILKEFWQWTCKDNSKGESIIIEI